MCRQMKLLNGEDLFNAQRVCEPGFNSDGRGAREQEDQRELSPMVIKQQKLFDDFPMMASQGFTAQPDQAQQPGECFKPVDMDSSSQFLPLLNKKDTVASECSEHNQNNKKRNRKACTKRNQKL